MQDVGITLVTPTRDRAEAFALCVHWMSRQTYRQRGPVQWVVVDDGDRPVEEALLERARSWGWTVDYIRRPVTENICTLQDNLIAALEVVRGDALLIIEDDEFYSPIYIEEMLWRLEGVNLVGEGNARYYNIRDRRWDIYSNMAHACLCRTGLKRVLYPLLREAARASKASQNTHVDIQLWALPPPPPPPEPPPGVNRQRFGPLGQLLPPEKSNRPIVPQIVLPQAVRSIFSNRSLSVGIKGMPGRGGLGGGHRIQTMPNHDASWDKLVEWLGSDARSYMDIANRMGWKPL
jgi:hypothetical protein